MKKASKKFLLGACAAAAFLLSSAAQAITVPGAANLFHGGDFTGLLPSDAFAAWTPGDQAVSLGSFTAGTTLVITATGTVDYNVNKDYGDSTPVGTAPVGGWTHPPVLTSLNGGAGFLSGALIGVWSSSSDPDNITPIGSPFLIGSAMSIAAQTGYLFAGIADEGWSDNGGAFNVNVTPVPLPASLWLMGSGLLGLLGYRRFHQGNAINGADIAT